MPYIIYGAPALLFLVGVIKLFNMPFKPLAKVFINVLAGFALLVVFNIAGRPFDMSVGVNAVNVGVVAVLGVPGFALLLMLQLLLG